MKQKSGASAPRRGNPISRGAWISVMGCLIGVLLIVCLDGSSRLAFVEKISAISFSEPGSRHLPVAPGAREEWLVLPYYSMDARWWVLHTEKMLREKSWRVRQTQLDNAPEGREVHWSSFLMWILAGIAWLASWGGGSPQDGVAEAALVAGPALMLAFLTGSALLAARFCGVFPSLFYVVVLLTCYPLMRTFLLGEADHHGIVIAFALMGVLCLLAGGCGLARGKKKPAADGADPPELAQATRWFAAAGIFGAASLWVSAATAIPLLAGTAIGGFLAGLAGARGASKSPLSPGLWMTWGWAGGLASVGFYLLEYFPFHLGWRLEVNHPVYAAAWLGGAYWLSTVLGWVTLGKKPPSGPLGFFAGLAATLAVIAPAAMIILFSDQVFWVSDRFLLALHKQYIFEFQSLPHLIRLAGGGLGWLAQYPWPLAAIAATAWLAGTGTLSQTARLRLILLAPPTLIMQTLAVLQVRWGSAASAMWALWILVLMTDAAGRNERPAPVRWVWRGLLATAWLALGFSMVPQILSRAEEELTCLDAPIPRDIAGNLLLRDVAHRLIQSSPNQVPVVLTGPNASTEMAYHAGIRTVGTLYWENMPGLKRAARIFSARDEQTALKDLTDAGVTHIVVPSWDNFAEAYARLLAEAEGKKPAEAPFFKDIVEGDACPVWLRPFAYPIPTNSGLDTNSVRVFAVLPHQSEFESLFYRGVYYFEIGRLGKAREMFVEAAKVRPEDERPRTYLREIEARKPSDAG